MQKIEISRTNVFEERAKEFSNSKLSHRLREKYKARPYEEQRKSLYLFAYLGTWLCHTIAIVASASFVFGFCYSLVANIQHLPYPVLFAGCITLVVLVFIEGLKRITVPDLFKDAFQYGFQVSYLFRIGAIVVLVGVSTLCSFKGGHEFVALVLQKPTYNEPSQKNDDDIRKRYKPKISDAKTTAETYRQSKLWHGKLSDQNAHEYTRLLGTIAHLESEENKEIQALHSEQKESKKIARSDYEKEQKKFEDTLQKRGSGFAGFSIFGEILFLLFVWFMERYDYKTATQYAFVGIETKAELPVFIPQPTSTTPATPPHSTPPSTSTTLPTSHTQRQPIGFHIERENEPTHLLQQPTQTTHTAYTDQYTVLHTGQKTHQRYTMARVKNYQKTYTDRAKKAREQGNIKSAEHNEKQVLYWQKKEKELLSKLSINTP